jgi:non-ribosomal peptide synthetase component F
LRTDFSGDPTFRQVLGRVKARSLEAFAHQDVSFDKLVEVLNPARKLSHTPLFQVLFVLQNAPVAQLDLPGVTLKPVRVDHKTSKYDLSLFIHDREGDLPSAFLYRTDLFDASTVARIRENYLRLLEAVTANPDAPISSIPLDIAPKSDSPLDKLRGIKRRSV